MVSGLSPSPSDARGGTFVVHCASLQNDADTLRVEGGSNITTIRLSPQRGQRNRLSSRESGNARPRVHTSVSMSNSLR